MGLHSPEPINYWRRNGKKYWKSSHLNVWGSFWELLPLLLCFCLCLGWAPWSVCLPEDRDRISKKARSSASAAAMRLPASFALQCWDSATVASEWFFFFPLGSGNPSPSYNVYSAYHFFIFFFLYKICSLVSVTMALGFVGSTLTFFFLQQRLIFLAFVFTSCLLIFAWALMAYCFLYNITIFSLFSTVKAFKTINWPQSFFLTPSPGFSFIIRSNYCYYTLKICY